jgi:altronate dehydratase small subunit
MKRAGVFFQIHDEDNVGTLLEDVAAGERVSHRGEGTAQSVYALQAIMTGHKIALRFIASGEAIIKYGFTIGIATIPIEAGGWVHLHNCASRYDEKSSHLDIHSGARRETRYA